MPIFPFQSESLLESMHLIVIHKKKNTSTDGGCDLLRFATSDKLFADITFGALLDNCHSDDGGAVIAVPEEWPIASSHHGGKIIRYGRTLLVGRSNSRKYKADSWFTISNGRFVACPDQRCLGSILSELNADVVAVNVDQALSGYREVVRLTSDSKVAGFRRLYSDSILPVSVPADWPHHICIRQRELGKIMVDRTLPLDFAEFLRRCKAVSLTLRSVRIAGAVSNLETEESLLRLLAARLHSMRHQLPHINGGGMDAAEHRDGCTISAKARIYGKVLLGENVRINDNAVIVGPAMLADNVKIASAAVVKTSVVGPGLAIPKGYVVQNRIITEPEWHSHVNGVKHFKGTGSTSVLSDSTENNFRIWPKLSYSRCGKRIADIIASLIVLVLFAPIFPIIAIALKLNSPGPVFFRHRRQGLYGKEFFCLKFRTMIAGAEGIQEKLRFKNQVDGPQFKVEDDPRITVVGKFLRDTFIDEIPQFINILLGQMSVAGPRPSPKAENSTCPVWRDARLSVRPGITGLWQIFRTRRLSHDFQEWIYYDIKYVRELSLWLDLVICWRTAKKLVINFIDQF